MALKRNKPSDEELKDLGFGSRVTENSPLRLLNRDGSFNVERDGLPFLQSIHLYHSLLTMSWWRFYLTITAVYIFINALFALVFVFAGVPIDGATSVTIYGRFLEAFFFSVQTFTTVGYGRLSPIGVLGNIIASFDAFVGLISFAIATGLLFARFSRPNAKILFSEKAIIAPYKDITAFEFRMANVRSNQLVNIEVKVLFSELHESGGKPRRSFHELPLERHKVNFLPLHLTVVHPIEKGSPLRGLKMQDLEKSDAEFLVLISAFDETFSQTVHTRTSYKFSEIVWGVKFSDMFQYSGNGVVRVDLKRIHDFESMTVQR